MGLTHSPSITTDGLVLCLDAGNVRSYPRSGTSWNDLSGNGNNGTLVNGPTFNESNSGNIILDGSNDYIIDTSTNNLPLGNSDRTIQLWAKISTLENNFVQIGTKGYGTGLQAHIFECYAFGSTVYLYTDGINSANNLTISGDQIPSLNIWNHLVFKNVGQNWSYYINGVLKKTGTWLIAVNTIGQQYVIGKRMDYPSNTVSGNISQVSIYNRALSTDEVKQNYLTTKGRFGL